MGLKLILLLWFRVDLKEIAMKKIFTLPKLQDWSLTNQMKFNVRIRTLSSQVLLSNTNNSN